jgi:site-specific DNA-methyltransferase (adenine-specific)
VKKRSKCNRTITLSKTEISRLKKKLMILDKKSTLKDIENKTICQDLFSSFNYLPDKFVDLMIADPPYNLDKNFNSTVFRELTSKEYEKWLDSWIPKIIHILKPTASFYICGDWKSSSAIYNVIKKYFYVQNRITFEREKGRGAKTNWKNCSEDIWFCTLSNNYYFNVDAVKIRRKVLAPYKDKKGDPKDWVEENGDKFRFTYPSNIWTDITIPFWSMPENTIHPTQKPEKLIAKIILASSKDGDLVFDPFLGSGTTSVVSKKLRRKYVGVEIDELYGCLTEKRLELVNENSEIQGYYNGTFWERNSAIQQYCSKNKENIFEIPSEKGII